MKKSIAAFVLALNYSTALCVPAIADSRAIRGVGAAGAGLVLPDFRGAAKVGFCIDPVAVYGADPTGIAASTTALQNANTAAASTASLITPGVVCVPAGNFKTTATVVIPQFVSFLGAGTDVTSILPTNNGDALLVSNTPASHYAFGNTVSDLTISRSDNATAGACVHFDQTSRAHLDRVELIGCFRNLQLTSSINFFGTDLFLSGDNSAAGSALLMTDSDNGNNVVHINNLEAFSKDVGGYTYAAYITNADGLQISNVHFGRGSTAGIYLHPLQTTDPIDNVLITNSVIDPSGVGILCDTQPGSYAANFGEIIYQGTIHGSTTAGFSNSCAAMHDVNLANVIYLDQAATAVSITAGTDFNLSGSLFDGANTANGGSNMVNIGAATGVVLNGAIYKTGSSDHAVPYNINITSASADVTARNQRFSGAATGDVSMTAGAAADITTAKTDKALTCASTGIGASGTCTVLGAGAGFPPSTNEHGFIRLTTAGGGEGTNGVITLTPTFAAPHGWNCSYKQATYSTGAWGNTTAIVTLSSSATAPTAQWANNASGTPTALTDAKNYGVIYNCTGG